MTAMETTDVAQPERSRTHRRLLILLAIVTLCCVAVVTYFAMNTLAFIRAFVVGETGPVTSSREWPKPLKELTEGAAQAKITIEDVKVHCLCQGFDPEYVWRMRASRGLFDLLRSRWELSPTPPPDRGAFCGKSSFSGDATPDWCLPKRNAETQFYASKRLLQGEKGDLFRVAVDTKREIVFVHYHYNF
jgi:hypothetical protein